jgi:hypothetical protein
MTNIVIIEDSSLGDCEATIAEETWKCIKSSKGASAFAQHSNQVLVGELFQGPTYQLKIQSEGHALNELRVSSWVKKTFYGQITSVLIGQCLK